MHNSFPLRFDNLQFFLFSFMLSILIAGNASTVESTPLNVKSSPSDSPETMVKDALDGNASAIAALRIAALNFDETMSMSVLERTRKSAVKRNSAVAACFLIHPEAWVQRTAINVITKLGVDEKDTLNLLINCIEKSPPLVAQAAAAALGDLRDPRSWQPLIDKLTAEDATIVRLAHESLRKQTNQQFPAEHEVWKHWYEERKSDEEAQFAHYQSLLSEASGNNHITAIDGLASLVLLRDQATAVLIALVDHPNQSVRDLVERHLRQWTGTLGNEPLAVAVTRAQSRAVAPPPSSQPINTTTAPETLTATPTASESTTGFFDSTSGILLIVTICCGALAILLWFLRTPVGQIVQGASQRFTQRVGRSRVVVVFSNSTKRFVNHLPTPVKAFTKRFTAPARTLVNKLAKETKRTLKPTSKPK